MHLKQGWNYGEAGEAPQVQNLRKGSLSDSCKYMHLTDKDIKNVTSMALSRLTKLIISIIYY